MMVLFSKNIAPRPLKKLGANDAFETDLTRLTHGTFDHFHAPLRMMLTVRMLYENPALLRVLAGSREHYYSNMLIAAISYSVDHDPLFAPVRENPKLRQDYDDWFMEFLHSTNKQPNDAYIKIVDAYLKIVGLFGEQVGVMTQTMVAASHCLQAAQQIPHPHPHDPLSSITDYVQEHIPYEKIKALCDTLPDDFIEQCRDYAKICAPGKS